MKVTIQLPEEVRARLGYETPPKADLNTPFPSIDEYIDAHGTLTDLTDQVFRNAIDGGYITEERARRLAEWFDRHPLIASIYPYAQLKRALETATSENGWSEVAEAALLGFIGLFCLQRDFYSGAKHLLDAPTELFGDLYMEMFHVPAAPIDLHRQTVEVTGPCEKGTHKAMIERAAAAGAYYNKRGPFSRLFVANSHIAQRVVSTKMLMAIFAGMRDGQPVLILSEDHF